MAVKKFRKPVLGVAKVETDGTLQVDGTLDVNAGMDFAVQSLTGASTGTQINNYGVTHITSTGSGSAGVNVYTIANPVAGRHKYVIGVVSSTKAIQVRTVSSAATSNFANTTKNSFTFTTGSTYLAASVHLIGLSSVQWAVITAGGPLGQSTAANTYGLTIAGATA